ncbi:EF-hand domain-containing protein [Bizionia sp. KMM 8389]
MKPNNLSAALLVFGLFLVTNLTFAQQQKGRDQKKPPTFSELLEKMDANEDGKLAKDEISGNLKNHFSDIDTDEDGYITEEELKNAPKPKKRD